MKLIIEDIFFFIYEYSLKLSLWITNNSKTKIQKAILFLVCMPYMLLICLLKLAYEYTVGMIIQSIYLKKDRKKIYKYDLAIVAIAKDEAAYIREWVAYYRAVCEDKVHIYLYDNGSTDGMKDEIQDYIDEGYVTYIDFPGVKKQLPAYDDAINNYKNEARYMAFIDIDEFIVPTQDENLTDYINKLIESKCNVGGVGINWKIYGSSGYKTKQSGIVVETFMKRSNEEHWGNTHVKTICNPRLVKQYISCHYPLYKLGTWSIAPDGKRQRLWWNKHVKWDKIGIHHYFCKSEEEFWVKRERGRATTGGKYQYDRFLQYDENGVEDRIMERYLFKIKSIM